MLANMNTKPNKNPNFGNLQAIIAKNGINKFSCKSIYKGNA